MSLSSPMVLVICLATVATVHVGVRAQGGPARPWNIAHRGAAAYAPENTIPAFLLAAEQGAGFVEFDLQRTKDGALVCLHDFTLERTTDVERLFPDRARPATEAGKEPQWWLEDFTLQEVKRLDAGAWFDPKFAGTRIPTFRETIRALKGRSGLFIELKGPERYQGIEAMMLEELRAEGLDQPGADPRAPVLIQSFTVASIERLSAMRTSLPLHVLIGAKDADVWLSRDGLARIRMFASGISPEKVTLETHSAGWREARALKLAITPWTFRASTVKGYSTVTAEMSHYLSAGGVDGVITDNPDLVPR